MIVLLNNATQPLAGLLVGLFAGDGRVGLVMALTAVGMALVGGLITAATIRRGTRGALSASAIPLR